MSPKLKIALQLLASIACLLYYWWAIMYGGHHAANVLSVAIVLSGIIALLPAMILVAAALDTYNWYFRN